MKIESLTILVTWQLPNTPIMLRLLVDETMREAE